MPTIRQLQLNRETDFEYNHNRKIKYMNAQQQLLAKYGEPNATYMHTHTELWEVRQLFPWFPVAHFTVNSDFRNVLVKAFYALEAKGLQHEIKTFDGCYNDRSVRGSNLQSLHSWGCAIDLNAAEEGMQSIPADKITPEMRLGKWSAEFVNTMKDAGLFYGGDFHSIHSDGTERIDPMHFAYLNG